MKYLIIDKKQRVEIAGNFPYATQRLFDELEIKKIPYHFGYWDQVEIFFDNKDNRILIAGEDIRNFTHILFRGHRLDKPISYETKMLIVGYIEQHNKTAKKKILLQNSAAHKKLPFYDKLYIGLFCAQNDIPYIPSYYRTDGGYRVKQLGFDYPLIIKDYTGANDLRMIDGKEKIKKNVFLLEKDSDFDQEFLKEKELEDYLTQEFIPGGEDMRIFVINGNVHSAFIRRATEGFMTVRRGSYDVYNIESDTIAKTFAEDVAKKFEANFIAVDIMYDQRTKKPLLQEFSFTPGYKIMETKIEGQSFNIAKEVIEAF